MPPVSYRCPVQKPLLDLGEINDSDRAGWTRAIEAVDERDHPRQIHLFPEDRTPDPRLEHPALKLRLDLDTFWQPPLTDSRKGTPWFKPSNA